MRLIRATTRKTICLLLYILLVILLIPAATFSDTHEAVDCTHEQVQTAINAATGGTNFDDGDIVSIPAGSCPWDAQVSINNKIITLRGAGNSVAGTVITGAMATDAAALLVTNKPARITNIRFVGSGTSNFGIVSFGGWGSTGTGDDSISGKGFRLDNNVFAITNQWGFTTRGLSYGVVDNNTFSMTGTNQTMNAVLGDRSASWSRDTTLGTSKAVFVENNTFTKNAGTGENRPVLPQGGARFVFRHNSVTNFQLDEHGLCGDVGNTTWELYNNTFTLGQHFTRLYFIRGGVGVVYNNVATLTSGGSVNSGFDFTDYRVNGILSCSSAGDTTCCTSYPCKQQLGRGAYNVSYASLVDGNSTGQVFDPVYIWNNTIDGSPATVQVVNINDGGACSGTMSTFIQQDRDYYVGTAKPGYTAYAYPHPLTVGSDPGPIRSAGSPSGTLSAGTTQVDMSLTTGVNASCKYGTSDVAYASLPNFFATTGGTSHLQNLTGLTNGSAYTYYVRCQDASLNTNSTGYPISFSVAAASDTTPPVRSAGAPSGELPAGTTSSPISLTTDENATCRYGTTPGVAYASKTLFGTTGGTSHSQTISGLSNGGSYAYYVRCQDSYSNANVDDYGISFTVGSSGSAAPSGIAVRNSALIGATVQ